MTQSCILKPDTKGRITLGKLAKGVSSFHVIINSKKGQIILEPYTEIPLKESWLFNNKKALEQLNNGIKGSAKGQVKYIEDFSKFQASKDLEELENNKSLEKRLKAVRKTLAYLQTNPHHPSLNTHKYKSTKGDNGEEIFEAYAENNTPAAYRIFWHYGDLKKIILPF